MPYSFRKRSVQAAPTLRAPPKAATTRAIGVASLAAIAAGLPLVLLLLLSLSTATFTGAATAIKNNVVTRNADNARTNYYGDSGLRKQDFDAGDFGLAFVAKLDGDAINNNVTAQPLVYTPKSYGKPIVLVATEYNTIYILDAASGTILASQNYGPVGPTNVWGFPSVVAGILATPVIDADTDTVYFVSCRATGENQVKYYFYAADVMTLQVKSGFPVAFAGVPAANDAGVVFDDYYEKSRAALLMTGGMVVVCFAGYDIPPYQGWIHVIDPTTGAFKTAFSTVSSKDMGQGGGGGIWMAGYGPSTLDDGRILVATGNGIFNASAPPGDAIVVGTVLTHPTAARSSNATAELPRTYFEAVVTVQMDAETGALAPIDWYTPYNGTQMDYNDTDTAADAVVVLPEVFGSTATPRLVLAGAKQGPIKFLDLNSLGGYQQGPNGTDNIVAEINPYPYSPTGLGVWGSAGVYPLEGGYLYFALAQGNIQAWRRSANTTDGRVAFEFAGATAENFRGGVSTPIVAGTGRAGEAVIVTLDAEPLPESDMWEFVDMERITFWDSIPTAAGELRSLFRFNVTSRHFGSPGVGGGMVYVASLDGHVYAFGPSRAFYAPKGSSYAGCFPDDGSDSTTGLFATRVPAPSGTAAGHSVDTCVAAAATKGLAWAGLRAGGECYVGGAWGNKTLLAARGDRCAAPCAGNATQICGGAESVSVYAVASVGASPSPSSTGGAGLSTTAVAGIAVGAVAVVCVVVGVLAVVVLRRRRGGGVDRRGSGVDSDGAKKEGASGPSFMLTE